MRTNVDRLTPPAACKFEHKFGVSSLSVKERFVNGNSSERAARMCQIDCSWSRALRQLTPVIAASQAVVSAIPFVQGMTAD
jgi:hypothetical protein